MHQYRPQLQQNQSASDKISSNHLGQARKDAPKMQRYKQAMALLVIAALIASMVGIISAYREEAFASDTVNYSCGEELHYGEHGWFTHIMNCDDALAYCVQPNLNVPANGSYQKGALTPTNASLDNIKALLWFGYGGPGFDPEMWPHTYSDGTALYSNLYYVITHVVLSHYFSSQSTETSLKGLSATERRWLSENIMAYEDASSGFGPGNADTFAARCFTRSAEVPAGFECFSINASSSTQTIVSFVATGDITVAKVSSNHTLSDFNTCYTTKGIIYDVYADNQSTHPLGSVQLDESGNATTLTVSQGRYYLQERRDSCLNTGFSHDATKYELDVRAGRVNTLRISDAPQYATIEFLVAKNDAESQQNHPLGAASLKGAQFQVDFYGGQFSTQEAAETSGTHLKSWTFSTDEHGYAPLNQEYLISGDSLYTNSFGQAVIPLGTLVIKETAAPPGYLLNDTPTYVRTITTSGTEEVIVGYETPQHPNQVKRGDLEFIKASETDMSRLAHVGFRLTSESTGESHIVVTDENGYFNSSADWNPHTLHTNANDTLTEDDWISEQGIWFGMTSDNTMVKPDDSLGALPYDTYTLCELRCSANEHVELIEIEHISIKRDATCINLGTIDDPLKQTQYISSRAYDGHDFDKTFPKDTDVTLVDSVDFTNLVPGKTYTLKTRLVYRENGNDVYSNGSAVTAQHTFTAQESNGKTTVEVTLNTAQLTSEAVVFFETLYQDDMLLAQDCDLDNPDQTLRLQEPHIKTRALDALDSDKSLSADRNTRIIDVVDYSNLVEHETYTLVGELMIIAPPISENDPPHISAALDAAGQPITARTEFSATSSQGQTEVIFQFDGLTFANDTKFVVFERLFKDDTLISQHCDPKDQDQSITLMHPLLDTYAYNMQTKTKLAPVDETIQLRDNVTYNHLAPHEDYTLIGILMHPESETPLTKKDADDNNENDREKADRDMLSLLPDHVAQASFVSYTDFTPTTSSGEAYVDFDIKEELLDVASDEAACNVVIYEYLIKNNEIVASHDSPSDANQTITLAAPKLFTEACDKTDGDHEISALEHRSIIDTVFYDHLVPGKEYRIDGVLMDKTTGEALIINGQTIETTVLFTPNSSAGHIEVEFYLDAQHLKNRDIVVFEYLTKDDQLIAEHADITDEAQSIRVSGHEGSPLAQTGDLLSDPHSAAITAATAGLILFAAYFMRKTHRPKKHHRPQKSLSKRSRLIESLSRPD